MTRDLTDEVKEHLATKGYDPVYGARPLNRVLQKDLLNPLAMLMIRGQVKEGDDVKVEMQNSKLHIVPNHPAENEGD